MSKAVLDKTKNSSNAVNKLSLQGKQDQEPKRGSNQCQENNSSKKLLSKPLSQPQTPYWLQCQIFI